MEKASKTTNRPFKLAITGPESSGKTHMASELSRIFKQPWLPEYAREYLTGLAGPYTRNDLDHIARRQLAKEKELLAEADFLLICDTDAVNLKVWYEDRFGEVPSFVSAALHHSTYDHHLLLRADIEYEDDPLRENPERGEYFFERFLETFNEFRLPFTVIEGDDRIKKARTIVSELLQARAI